MTSFTKLLLPLLCFSATLFITGCEQQGPAERAGEKVDESVEKAGDKVEQAGENIKDSAN